MIQGHMDQYQQECQKLWVLHWVCLTPNRLYALEAPSSCESFSVVPTLGNHRFTFLGTMSFVNLLLMIF